MSETPLQPASDTTNKVAAEVDRIYTSEEFGQHFDAWEKEIAGPPPPEFQRANPDLIDLNEDETAEPSRWLEGELEEPVATTQRQEAHQALSRAQEVEMSLFPRTDHENLGYMKEISHALILMRRMN